MVLMGLLAVVGFTFEKLAGVLDVKIPVINVRPFAGIATAINNTIVQGCNDGIASVGHIAADFEAGLVLSWQQLLDADNAIVSGIRSSLSYLWNSALQPLIHSITDVIASTASAALAKVESLAGTVSANVTRAEAYADAQAARALGSAKTYAESQAAAAINTAERYADTAVSKLAAAEQSALANAVGIAAAATAAVEGIARADLSQAESDAASALATAQALGQTALQQVSSIAVTAEDDVETLAGAAGIAGAAALIASIPAIATLVTSIATESGLENESCRTKVKGICGTDPAAWANLLAGLVAIGFAFSLEELAAVARPIVSELAPVIAKAA